MAPYSYPLTVPADPQPRNCEIGLKRAEAISISPFNFNKQIHEHSGTQWMFSVQYPMMTHANGKAWAAFLLELKGMVGTFYFSNPDGNLGTPAGSPLVNAFAGDKLSVTTTGWDNDAVDVLKAGDFISFSNYEYKMVMEDVTADAGGEATIYFQPVMRTTVANGTAIATAASKGIFRLASPNVRFTSNQFKYHEITLVMEEDI